MPPRTASEAANSVALPIATTGTSRASANALANAIDTRSPVNPPGPVATATASSCHGSTPASSHNARSSSQKASRSASFDGSNARS